MSNVIRMPCRRTPHSAIDEKALQLEEVTIELLRPMEELENQLHALDRELARVRITADALDDRPETRALRQAIDPIRDQLVLAASQLAREIEQVGGFDWTRH